MVIKPLLPSLLTGSIPTCIWTLPKLQNFQIAGNGLVGPLPSDGAIVSRNLTRINLAYNRLTGSIAKQITLMPFQEFDITSNKVSGTFNYYGYPIGGEESVFQASLNRLSGRVPTQRIEQFATVDILFGNIFSCAYMGVYGVCLYIFLN